MHVPEQSAMQKLKETGVTHAKQRMVVNIKPTSYEHLVTWMLSNPKMYEKACVEISEAQPLAGKQEGKAFCTKTWQTGHTMLANIRDMSQEERDKYWMPLTSQPCPAISKKYKDFQPNPQDSKDFNKNY